MGLLTESHIWKKKEVPGLDITDRWPVKKSQN